jgi:membrane protein DedA with SNARE-associated domain
MIDTLTTFLQNFSSALSGGQNPHLGVWAYFLLALLVAVEGPVATLLGAAAASAGWLNPVLVFIFAAGGNLTADSLWYTLGYAGKLEWIMRIGRRLGMKLETLQGLEAGLQEHAARILFFAKLTVSFMIPTLIATGLAKIRWRRWFPALFGGEMIWTGSLVLIGYFATQAIKRIEMGIEYAILGLSLLFILAMFGMGRSFMRKHVKRNETGQ